MRSHSQGIHKHRRSFWRQHQEHFFTHIHEWYECEYDCLAKTNATEQMQALQVTIQDLKDLSFMISGQRTCLSKDSF